MQVTPELHLWGLTEKSDAHHRTSHYLFHINVFYFPILLKAHRKIARYSIFNFPDTFDSYMSTKTFATDQYQFIINNGIYVIPILITPERLITHNILLTAMSARESSIKRILGSLRVCFRFRAAAEHHRCGNGK